MPMLGLGVWQVPDGPECVNAVRWALELGYRHIDTAQALRQRGERRERASAKVGCPATRCSSRRSSIRAIATPPPKPPAASSGSGSTTSTSTSCTGLRAAPSGPGRVWNRRTSWATPVRSASPISTWPSCRPSWPPPPSPPVVNQVQFSPFKYRRRLLEAGQQGAVVLEAYSPLGTARYLSDRAVKRMAQRLGRTPAQVLLRWCLQHGVPVIPKSTHRERIEENARIFDFTLSTEDMAELDAQDKTRGTDDALERKWW